MKKINIKNSTSYRSTGPRKNVQHFCGWFHAVSSRCCIELVRGKTDEIPRFRGMTMAVIAALFIATPSFAEPTELDKKTVASKAYVDTKQDKITTGLVEFNGNPDFMLPAITTYDTTNGLVSNKIGILDWQTAEDVEGTLNFFSYEGGGYGSEMDNYVPTVRAVAESLRYILENMPYWNALSWSNTQSVAINAYNSTFGNGTNNWAGSSADLINGQFLANSLALKQNKLPELDTNLVLGQAGQSVLAPTTAGNVTQVALWDADGAEPDAWDVNTYFSGATADERNAINYSIPTVGAVAVGLDQKQKKIAKSGYYHTMGTILTAYGNDSNANGWLNAGVRGTGLVTKTATDGVVGERKIFEASDVANYHATGLTQIQKDIQDISIPTVGAVMNIVSTNAPTGTANTLANYDANGALGSGIATANAPTHNATTGVLENGTNIATIAAVDTRQKKKQCAGYETGHENDPAYCWLWDFPED